jgi:hypothetical protein
MLALSRRCCTCHSLDSHAFSTPLQRAEDFLKTAARLDRFGGGAFDFISVCPPYELVDYVELYDLLEVSPLVRHIQDVEAARRSVYWKVLRHPFMFRCSRHRKGRPGFGMTQVSAIETLILPTLSVFAKLLRVRSHHPFPVVG